MLLSLALFLGVQENRSGECRAEHMQRIPFEGSGGESGQTSSFPFFRLTSVEGDSVRINPGRSLFLEPNAPNPFSDRTTISYSLDRETRVTLRVFDAFYNEIVLLVDDEFQVEGRYEVVFNPDDMLASGMYFFSLTTSAGVETRRMLLVK